MRSTPNREALSRAARLLEAAEDLLATRPMSAEPPPWAVARGWATWLAALEEAELPRLEREGLGAGPERASMPPSLISLCDEARAIAAIPRACEAPPAVVEKVLGANPRKLQQVCAFVGALRDRGGPRVRVVDMGAGHGHLTRVLSQALGAPALGVESVEARVWRAQTLARDAEDVDFVHLDAVADPLPVEAGDLVVGLHACGRLSDAAVAGVIAEPRAGLAVVGCCLQKLYTEGRAPLSHHGLRLGLRWPTPRLALGNYAPPTDATQQAERLRRQRLRHGLVAFLRGRGVEVDAVSALREVPKRWLSKGLGAVAGRAAQVRGWSPPTPDELEAAEAEGAHVHGRIRRWELPRVAMARIIELSIAWDRACALEEAWHPTEVMLLFPAEVSPRNLLILSEPV